MSHDGLQVPHGPIGLSRFASRAWCSPLNRSVVNLNIPSLAAVLSVPMKAVVEQARVASPPLPLQTVGVRHTRQRFFMRCSPRLRPARGRVVLKRVKGPAPSVPPRAAGMRHTWPDGWRIPPATGTGGVLVEQITHSPRAASAVATALPSVAASALAPRVSTAAAARVSQRWLPRWPGARPACRDSFMPCHAAGRLPGVTGSWQLCQLTPLTIRSKPMGRWIPRLTAGRM